MPPPSYAGSAASATVSTPASNIRVELINPNYARSNILPNSISGSIAPATVPSRVSATTQVKQINPSYTGPLGYDKDTIYVLPSFNARKINHHHCHHLEPPDLDSDLETEFDARSDVVRRQHQTSIYVPRGEEVDDDTKAILRDLLHETQACEERKIHDIATLQKDAVSQAGHYLGILERALRQYIPPSAKIRLLDAETHESEICAHGFVHFESPATSQESSATDSNSEGYEDEDKDEYEYENPNVSPDEEDYEDGEEDITYYPQQGDHMGVFDSKMAP